MSLRRMPLGKVLAIRGALRNRERSPLAFSSRIAARVAPRSRTREIAADFAADLLLGAFFFVATLTSGLIGVALFSWAVR